MLLDSDLDHVTWKWKLGTFCCNVTVQPTYP